MKRTFLLLVTMFFALTGICARASDVRATTPLVDSETGHTVGYKTNESSVYFLLPRQWTARSYEGGPTAFVKDLGTGEYDVRFALAADYSESAATIAEIRSQDGQAMFFPLPRINESLSLFLPGALGNVQASLTPDDSFTNFPVAYYRLRLNQEQLDALVSLAHGGLALTGTASVVYKIGTEQVTSALPVTVRLRPEDLSPGNPSAVMEPSTWLSGLLQTYELRHGGDLDGTYSLGGMVKVSLAQSLFVGSFIPRSYAISRSGTSYTCGAVRSPDFSGKINFFINELGVEVILDFSASISLALDTAKMEVAIKRFDVNQVAVNGHISSFYRHLINGFLTQSDVQARLSKALTNELQRRILSKTLFGVEAELQ